MDLYKSTNEIEGLSKNFKHLKEPATAMRNNHGAGEQPSTMQTHTLQRNLSKTWSLTSK